ncbi:trace amine-associated receptor 1-like [Alosa sapidissima]|uniref:trace amine-associated receptor 1-like n=1 Tax=Alosa sapidissima TaxID=34773 RepID=UPI001C099D95|nr:trace amine-associated receptor 1-like [Alosa sapidissima]
MRDILNDSETSGNIPHCYNSVNGSCPNSTYPIIIRAPLYIFFGITVVLTVVGNLLVITTVIHFKQLHTPTNYLILSLAVADLLLGGIVMPPSVMRSVESCWYFGEFFYRYYAVCHPLLYKSKMTISTVGIMTSISWIVSAIFGYIVVFQELNLLGMQALDNIVVCEGSCIVLHSLLSSSFSAALSFYIPGLIIVSIYLKIFLVAQEQARSVQIMNATRKSSLTKMERKATKTLAVIMGVFLSSWIPFVLVFTIDPYIDYKTPPLVFDLVTWIGYLNSTFNPVVYAYFYSWFRHALKIIMSGKIFQNGSSRIQLFSV